jgi:nucleolar protein 4
VSRTRVSVHNMPLTLTEGELRKMVTEACVYKGRLLQVKVVRSKDRIGTDAKLRSKGFGFLEFAEHEDALAVIAGMNNSPKFFDAKKRPILQFAWVDVQVSHRQRVGG